jgi:hypothetical protein
MTAPAAPRPVDVHALPAMQQIKTIVRGRGLQIVGTSAGFRQIWPETCSLMGQNTRDLLVNEAATYCEDGDYLREASAGELLMVTGVSNRLLAVGGAVPPDFRVRWHAIIRHIDGELIHEMIYEPCDANTLTGFERLLRRSDLKPQHE